MIDRAQAQALLDGITPGPWSAETASEHHHPKFGIFTKRNTILSKAWLAEDARAIASLPDILKAYIASIEREPVSRADRPSWKGWLR